MFRKMTAILLALLLALGCVSALAEDFTAYTHPHLGYSFDYPSEYIALDSETIGAIEQALINGEIDAFDFDFSSIRAQIEAMDIVTFMDVTNGNNINVATIDMGISVPLSADMLVSMVLPATLEQYKAILSGCELIDEGSVKAYGDNEYARISLTYNLNGVALNLEQYFIVVDGVLYNVTYTYSSDIPQEYLENVLSSFKPAA